MEEKVMTREVIPTGAALGADVRGVDFSKPLGDEDKAFVQQAWNDHLVLRFRDQTLSDEDLIRMADEFGGSQVAGSRQYYLNAGYDTKSGRVSRLPGITIISNLDKDGKPEKENSGTGSSELFWHTDNSYVDNPPKGSILYGIQVPINGGGDTSFVNQYETYDALPMAMKERLLNLHIRHDNSRNTAGGARPTAKIPTTREEVEGPVHPMVRRHPVTGRNALYLGRRYASPSSYIVELPQDESEALLDELWAHATQKKFVWTQVWQPKDAIMWDNRCTMHTRNKIDHTQPREMHRSLIKGEEIIPATTP
jgi:taurine dioxygenase